MSRVPPDLRRTRHPYGPDDQIDLSREMFAAEDDAWTALQRLLPEAAQGLPRDARLRRVAKVLEAAARDTPAARLAYDEARAVVAKAVASRWQFALAYRSCLPVAALLDEFGGQADAETLYGVFAASLPWAARRYNLELGYSLVEDAWRYGRQELLLYLKDWWLFRDWMSVLKARRRFEQAGLAFDVDDLARETGQSVDEVRRYLAHADAPPPPVPPPHPEYSVDRALDVHLAVRRLVSQGIAPTLAELRRATGVDEELVAVVLAGGDYVLVAGRPVPVVCTLPLRLLIAESGRPSGSAPLPPLARTPPEAPLPDGEEIALEELARLFERHGAALKQHNERQHRVLSERFGLLDGVCRARAEVAQALGVSAERVRMIEREALRRLRDLDAQP